MISLRRRMRGRARISPLHALAMLKNPREGIEPDQPGVVGPIKQIEALQQKGYPLAYVGDVVGTGFFT
ncbi:bifunctional aconitate hydratase 2/2-methylisocitrate dehydratase [Klebsiella pneumoniae subsp. ozaenae]|uniref:Bifunctional aconitate hydratase 2/2-methylisocitrate dehydratase n=1 Tax=Klebsiella pneumoniae subsp. ozaenae TaxID=574 RepID=A0A377Z000_KLEPO|nr:bifunctional aconitate hydratase 2/2-methylisocitrate dehydratase [Klebsiella pneumoniae subsp. ozaenae]